MRLKTLIILITLTPMLGFNLIAKADTCPKPEEFRKGFSLKRIGNQEAEVPAYYTGTSDNKADFMLREKPIRFSSAMFMSARTDENLTKVKGRLYSCEYYVEKESKPKLALSQAEKYKKVSILLDSSSKWKKHSKIKKRYECFSDNVKNCSFTLE
ncbi:MAG: DUF3757 domain-containing protein [Pseudomonadota bacterium]